MTWLVAYIPWIESIKIYDLDVYDYTSRSTAKSVR